MINWNNLQELLKGSGEKIKLSKKTGISTGNISDWFNPDKKAQPSADALVKIADVFDCSVDYLLGRTDIKGLSAQSTTIYYFPVFYQSAAAGIGRLSETEEYQMEEFKLKSIPKKAVFGMYIKGHSMETNIYENDIVLIDPSAKVSIDLENEIVVALFGDELVCKRFSVNEDDQTYDFSSDNSADKDKGRFHQKRNNFTLVGKVVKILHAHETGNGLFTYSED